MVELQASAADGVYDRGIVDDLVGHSYLCCSDYEITVSGGSKGKSTSHTARRNGGLYNVLPKRVSNNQEHHITLISSCKDLIYVAQKWHYYCPLTEGWTTTDRHPAPPSPDQLKPLLYHSTSPALYTDKANVAVICAYHINTFSPPENDFLLRYSEMASHEEQDGANFRFVAPSI